MHRIMPTMRRVLLGAAAAAIFVTTTYGQSILGPPSEANHFIETPKGWVHPKTPWGEPDIQANLNMMQAAGVPLERCANATRFGGPPCDMNKAWLDGRGAQAAHRRRRRPRRPRPAADREGRVRPRAPVGVTDPATPQRQTTLIVDPPNGLLPALTPEGKRRALEMRSGWSLPGESPAYDWPDRLRQLGPLHHARHALVDDAVSLQRRVHDLAGAGRRRVRPRDDPRRARHLHRRPAAAAVGAQGATWAIRAAAGRATRSSSRRRTTRAATRR